ncbi:MAG: hypothetical protein WEE53_03150 [Acidimicrobiia bacterium]
MTQNDAERMLELEESAEGVDLFRAPGEQLQMEKARDQAEASGWIPEKEESPVSKRRHDRARIRRHELRASTERLESTIARASGSKDWLDAVEAALADLRDALRAHIREVEAPDGLLGGILQNSPRLASDIEILKKEHVGLMESLEKADQALRAQSQEPPEIRRRATNLLGHLTRHRQHGSDLVCDAHNIDISAAN